MVGGTRDKLKGRIEGLRYDGIWLMAQDSEGEKLAASADRSIRNVAWGIADMDEAIVAFKAVGAKTLIEPFVVADVVRVAFYEDPNGVSGELLPRPLLVSARPPPPSLPRVARTASCSSTRNYPRGRRTRTREWDSCATPAGPSRTSSRLPDRSWCTRTPSSVEKPGSDSRHLHAGHRLGSLQGNPQTSPDGITLHRFRCHVLVHDESTVVHLRSSF